MKKIVLVMLIVLLQLPVSASYLDTQLKDTKYSAKYNTVDKYKKSFQQLDLNIKKIDNLKDPKLVQLKSFSKIPDKDYNEKLVKDEEVYKKIKTKVKEYNNVDYYHVYRIAERIIRANNLDYVNWRIAVRKTFDNVNAYSSDGNFLCIYTALYDTLSSNDDALAFVIAHEMAHQILGHSQRKLNAITNYNIVDNYTFAHDSKTMEYMADAEAIILLYKAGYSPQKSMEALHILSAIPNINSIYSTHPATSKRVENVIESIFVLDPNWIDEGRLNIYNSEVLQGKKSSDRVSVTILKDDKQKDFYQPETFNQRLTRIAYMNYVNGNMQNASKYFEKLADSTNSYEYYLYASYANQYLYEYSGKKSYMKKAFDNINKSIKLNSNDGFVKKQYDELYGLNN